MFVRSPSPLIVRFGIGALVALLLVAGVLILRRFEPTETSFYPKCVFYQLTGFHCPGCGGTRALRALALGDWLLAVRNNALVVLGGPVMLAAVLIQQRRHPSHRRGSPRLAWTICVVVSLFFVMRNLPSPTASPLAPPSIQHAR